MRIVGTLPALRDDHLWIGGGFAGIVEYLRKTSGGAWDLDWEISGEGRDYNHSGGGDGEFGTEVEEQGEHTMASYMWSESIAYSSFIRSRLGALLDISLYVSQVNYEGMTRPEFSKRGMLPWPVQYYVPGEKRAQAWERCEETLRKYGLGTGDVDPSPVLNSHAANMELEANAAGAGVSEGTGKGGVTTMFRKPQSASTAGVVFKLQTLISKSLTPVAVRLVEAYSNPALGAYFFKQPSPTSIDCLILGYLCLAVYPELPNPFLYEGIRELDGGRGGGRVIAWTHEFRRKVFGSMPIDGKKILNEDKVDPSVSPLPWGKVERADLPWLTGYFASSAKGYLWDYVPSCLRKKPEAKQKEESGEEKERRMKYERTIRRERFERIVTVLVGVGAFIGFLFATGVVSIVRDENLEEELERMKEEEAVKMPQQRADREDGEPKNGNSQETEDEGEGEGHETESTNVDIVSGAVTAADLGDFLAFPSGGDARNERGRSEREESSSKE